MKRVLTALAATLPFAAHAADALTGEVQRQPTNWQAIIMFLIFVVLTLYITYWASKRVRSRNDYYTAGGNITGFQNGVADPGGLDQFAATFPASRAGWRSRGTLCPPPRSLGSPRWCIPQGMTA